MLCQNLEVVGGEGETHREHDDAEDDGLCGSAHPVEGIWDMSQYFQVWNENNEIVQRAVQLLTTGKNC